MRWSLLLLFPDPRPLTAPSALPALPVHPRAAPTTPVPGGPGALGVCDPPSGRSAAAPRVGFFLPRLCTRPAPSHLPGSPGTPPQEATCPCVPAWGRPLTSRPEPPDTFRENVTGITGVPRTRPRTQGPQPGHHAFPDLHNTFLQGI